MCSARPQNDKIRSAPRRFQGYCRARSRAEMRLAHLTKRCQLAAGLRKVIRQYGNLKIRAALFLLSASLAHAQDSQFLFDPNGNLVVQKTAATTTPPQIIGQ